MIVHELKAWPHYFRPTWDGEKVADVRYDDRGYQRGDFVIIREWDRDATCTCRGSDHTKDCARYTGRQVLAEVGYVMASTPGRGSRRGFTGDGYVVLSLINLERVEAPTDARTTDNVLGILRSTARPSKPPQGSAYTPGGHVPTPRPPGDTS